ncbi:putative RING/FYVE/PHD zinc finger protein [Senna tora]|uniref:Putative RING/FYVE/PHD zinc finger protein n=1 Tax=Senna tora TaxID=362788 RepID=A0A834WXE2_9FABA|nr:putative RING/FYVE/PHD zinc finger protein [Senna tora]
MISFQTNICEKCGDKGNLKRLVFCVQCQVSAEHSYCLDNLHKEDDGTISWKCEECSQKDTKCGSVQLRKSGRISQAIEDKYKRMKIQKKHINTLKRKKSFVLDQASMSKSSEADNSNDLNNYYEDFPMKKRQLDLEEDDSFFNGDSESFKCSSNTQSEKPALQPEKYVHTNNSNAMDESESCMSQGLLYPECNRYSQVEPVLNPAWRGLFRMNNMTVLGLVAHLSSIACSKVHFAVTGLPPQLDVEISSRFDIWPSSFQMSPPTETDIAVYIFPQYESDEKDFDSVMNDLIEQNLALKASITNNVELLVFSSRVLPPENWRINRKYYLWGVFREEGSSKETLSCPVPPLS